MGHVRVPRVGNVLGFSSALINHQDRFQLNFSGGRLLGPDFNLIFLAILEVAGNVLDGAGLRDSSRTDEGGFSARAGLDPIAVDIQTARRSKPVGRRPLVGAGFHVTVVQDVVTLCRWDCLHDNIVDKKILHLFPFLSLHS